MLFCRCEAQLRIRSRASWIELAQRTGVWCGANTLPDRWSYLHVPEHDRGTEMASKEEYDRYAAELNARFEKFTNWAMENWPKREFPLLRSDFTESRREIAQIAGPKLGDGDTDTAPGKADKSAPFVDMNPMPWP
jgi:hypothetical protein